MSTDIKNSFERHKNFALLLCLFMLLLDLYFNYYNYFVRENLTHPIIDSFIFGIYKTGFLNSTFYSKTAILLLTGLFTLLDKGRKDIDIDKRTLVFFILLSTFVFILTGILPRFIDSLIIYAIIVFTSYLYVIKTYSYLSRLLNTNIMKDRFNKKNKIFPQMTTLVENEMSVNIPYKFISGYTKKDKPIYTGGYVNLIAPERATLVLGKPGSGKSYSFIEEIIRQHIIKGFSMINYDYKFPTLTNISYNYYNKYKSSYNQYENKGNFAVINLDDPRYSHRCNPVKKELITTKPQAVDAIYTLFFNIDKKSATKQDFFQMSAMSITSAALWFLRNFEDGKYCSLPHLIEFINRSDNEMLPILDSYADLRYFTAAFSDALAKESFEQLSGQTASARIPLGKLATDEMFWVMAPPAGVPQVDLRINKSDNVTILNIANNPDTQKSNGPALGLYMSQAAKLINSQNRVPCDFIVDELPTIFINGLNTLIATARSNKVCTVLSIQDYTQIVNEYGREQADTIFNTCDTIISGKVAIETAEKVSKGIGKINYQTQSISISKDSTSTSYNTQREYLVPPEDISQFSQGEFVGIVSDTFKQQIELKAFRGIVSPDKSDLDTHHIPILCEVTEQDLKDHSKNIQDQVSYIIRTELLRISRETDQTVEQVEAEQNSMQSITVEDLEHPPYGSLEQSENIYLDSGEEDPIDFKENQYSKNESTSENQKRKTLIASLKRDSSEHNSTNKEAEQEQDDWEIFN